jgi:glyoxylase-like metal-dependent hydrolase (beta-lactamase superfamily II)
MRIVVISFIICLLSVEGFAKKTAIKQITPNVIVVTPEKKQLQTLGWPNDIINSIAYKTSDGIVLVDTQNSPANANLIKQSIIERFSDTTFVYVINTHGHSCHSGGNCVFDQNSIVAQVNSAGEIKDYNDLFLGQTVDFLRKKIFYKSAIIDTMTVPNRLTDSINQSIDLYKTYEADLMNNYHARYADMTFEDKLVLTPGGKTIELVYMGKGHGDADIAVYMKDEKVLCTGNLFHLGSYSVEAMPSFYLNRPNEIAHWIQTLDYLLAANRPIDYVISTHGKRPFERKNIEFINDYCKLVQKLVKEAKAKELPLDSVKNLDAFKPLFEKYKGIISINEKVEEMHSRNIDIIWSNIQ